MKTKLSIRTLSNDADLKTQLISCLNIRPLYDVRFKGLDLLYKLPTMDDNFVKLCDVEVYEHLAGLQLPDVDTAAVQLIIGQDQSEAYIPLEVRRGKTGDSWAIRTVLGWALNGLLPNVDATGRRGTSNLLLSDHSQWEDDFILNATKSICQ